MKKLDEIENLRARIEVTIPISKEIPSGFPINTGAVILENGSRNFYLDGVTTDFQNPERPKSNLVFTTKLEVDRETFEDDGEDCNYDLLIKDLKDKKTKVTFFCTDDDMEYGKLNFKKAEMKLHFEFQSKTITLPVEFE